MDWFRSEHQALVWAIRKAAQGGFHEACWDLAVTAVTLFEADSLLGDWRMSAEEALEATRRASNKRGEAAILCSLGELAPAPEIVSGISKIFGIPVPPMRLSSRRSSRQLGHNVP